MFRVLEAQAPAKQTASETISVLCSRLSSATLLEDRRAAILGLRSFAKEYPASVSSGALSGLIASLGRDSDDVDTIKPVLETVLNLFNPLETSPEASDDIILWLSDQFTQKQQNFAILLDLVETTSFHSRLYSLQIISAISHARPSKTQQCILSAPLGATRLVATLRDAEPSVRSAGTQLLGDLSITSPELQKLIAYEGAFDHIFDNIEDDGGLLLSSIVAEDSLTLLANLVRHNSSNQALFRASGCFSRLRRLLSLDLPVSSPGEGVSPSAAPDVKIGQRDRNIWGVLAGLRLFLTEGGIGTHENQNSFANEGILPLVIQIAFAPDTGVRVRAEALSTCADMIRSNKPLQEDFAEFSVIPFFSTAEASSSLTTPTTGNRTSVEREPQALIEALLDLTLNAPSLDLFDIRLAAANCVIAYFYNHHDIKMHFLQRTIDGHLSGADEVGNVISTLLMGTSFVAGLEAGSRKGTDLYRVWFASMVLFHLIHQDSDTKAMLQAVKEGDSEEEEEEVTLIQAISGALIPILQHDSLVGLERDAIGYLTLLCNWLFEDPAAVNDFLEESSILHVLTVFVTRPVMTIPSPPETVIIRGLCVALLGIAYEFSRRDSPVSRRDIQSMLHKVLGTDKYREVLYDFRHEYHLRDFEVLPQGLATCPFPGSVPETFFHPLVVEFLKDRFPRISRAIYRDPGKEFHAANEEGVDRDVLDGLRQELEAVEEELRVAKEKVLTLETKLNQEMTDRKRENEASSIKYEQLRHALSEDLRHQLGAQQQGFDLQLQRFEKSQEETTSKLRIANENVSSLQQQAVKAETLARQATLAREEVNRQLATCEQDKRLAIAEGTQREREARELRDRVQRVQTELEAERARARDRESRIGVLMTEVRSAKEDAARVEKQREGLRGEVDRLKVQIDEAKMAAEVAKGSAQAKIKDLTVKVFEAEQKAEAAKVEVQVVTRQGQDRQKELAEKEGEVEGKTKELGEARREIDELTKKVEEADRERAGKSTEADKLRAECEAEAKAQLDRAVEAERRRGAEMEGVLEREVKTLRERLAKAEAELKAAKSVKNEAEVEAEAEAEKKRRRAEAEAVENAVAEAKNWQAKAEESEQGRRTAQAELDDILLVLTDMEEKKDRYKGRLRDRGEEVSDDDDDEDGEDE